MAAGIGLIVLIIVLVFGAIIGTWARRYRRAGPDEVLVISGRRNKRRNAAGEIEEVGFRVIRNGGTFVFPIIEEFERMSLHVISTQVATHNAISKEGVPLIVVGTALFKVAGDDTGIINAAERYLSRPQEDIERDVQAVLEGHLRGVCGQLTPEEIYQDRQAFQEQIAEQAQAELTQMGITLDTLTLRDISDEVGYLDALGRRRTAEVSRDARIGEANADREAAVAEALARQASERARAEADAAIAEAEKDRDVRKAAYDAETSAEEARAEQAAEQAEAEAKQRVAEAMTALAERRAQQRRQELESEVVAIAEADKQRQILDAEADKQRAILQAEADAQAIVARAEANKQSAVLSGEGDARQISDRGNAEASAIAAKLGAEAKGLGERAEALKQYTDEAIRVQLATDVIQALPGIVAAAASPLSHVDEIRIVDFGGGSRGNGGAGGPTSQLFGLTPAALGATDEALKQTIGVSLVDLIGLVRNGTLTPSAGAAGTPPPAGPADAGGAGD
ncbi:MAG: SPFH domain-containing protein [Chloroflexi bacterium]|nr:SPFH domain-containing protein [Chloroflexota bacterium]MDA1145663.1 SPFH domain-containing protein [Chloroflexota bacterium]